MDTQARVQSWKEKFYQLAELYLETDSLLKFCSNKQLKTRAEMILQFRAELTGEQQEAFNTDAKGKVSQIIEGRFNGDALSDPAPTMLKKTSDKLARLRREREAQRARAIRMMPLRGIIPTEGN